MQRYHTTGSTESFRTAKSPPSSPRPGSPEPKPTPSSLIPDSPEPKPTPSSPIPHTPEPKLTPNSPMPDSPQPKLTTRRLLRHTILIGSDNRRSIRRSTLNSPLRPTIREDGFVTFEYDSTSYGPKSPTPSILHRRTPSLFDSDFSGYNPNSPSHSWRSGPDFSDTSTVCHYRGPYKYTPPRVYLPDLVYAFMMFTGYILFFMPYWYEDMAMPKFIFLTGCSLFFLASYGKLIGVSAERLPAEFEIWERF